MGITSENYLTAKCSVIILSDRNAGSIKLKANSDNLKSSEIIINAVRSPLIPIINN